MNKTPATKISVTEVIKGMTVKGNLKGGSFAVAEIVIRTSHLNNTSTEYLFLDADGAEFFIGRRNAKATLA